MSTYIANLVTSLLLTAASAFVLGFFVWRAGPQRHVNQIFSLFCLGIAVWSGFSGWIVLTSDKSLAWIFLRVQYVGVVFIPILFCHYIALLTERPASRFLRWNYLAALAFTALIPTRLLIAGVERFPKYGFLSETPGLLYGPMVLWFFIPVARGVYWVWSAYRSATGARKNQMKYVFWGTVFGFLGGCGNYLYVFGLEIPWFNPNGTYGVPLYMLMTAYAIVRHRLMDINVVLKRTVIYTLIYSFSLAVFGFVVFFLGQWMVLGVIDRRLVLLSMVGLLFVVAMVHPLDRMLTRMTDRILFREKYKYQQTLKSASAGMGRIRSLPKLLTLIARVITNSVRVTHATVFLKHRDHPRFVVVASRGRFKKPANLLRLDETSPLIAWLSQHREPLVHEELRLQLKQDQPVRPDGLGPLAQVAAEMERLQASVCIPSTIDGTLKGFLMLGEKLSGDMYNQEDLDIFSTLANQAAIAIENAQAYEELRDTRDQLLQSERLATIGKFASDMAHEIKNPLQAIITFFDLLPEKYNDPDFRERFSRVAKAEAERISHLVRGLVTYTNPKNPQFQPMEVSQVIDSILVLLENDLLKHRVEVQKAYTAGSQPMEADRDQMKQVFLNLFMNAIDAMPPSNGKVNRLEIVTFPAGETFIVKIRDTGCGIAADHLPMLFAPFFSTKEHGSGLGLAIVQNILRAHHATIEVESQPGTGTTFTLILPCRQPSSDFSAAA